MLSISPLTIVHIDSIQLYHQVLLRIPFNSVCICTSGMDLPLPCERGFYCPSGSANQHPCPEGTYGNMSGLVEEWQCSLCDPGMYCKGTGTLIIK